MRDGPNPVKAPKLPNLDDCGTENDPGCLLQPVLALSRRSWLLVQVLVRDNNVDQALRVLKKKMQREGVFREMKLRRSYEKPSERRARERAEAVRRYRKLLRKRMEREGY
jgi:small subunit ribosomal protein S21